MIADMGFSIVWVNKDQQRETQLNDKRQRALQHEVFPLCWGQLFVALDELQKRETVNVLRQL